MRRRGIRTDEKRSAGTVAKDTWYAIRVLWKCSPTIVWSRVAASTAFMLWNRFFQKVYFLRELMALITNHADFGSYMRLLTLFAVLSAVAYVIEAVGDYVWDVQCKRVYGKLNAMIFEKASQADVACFEDPDFYNQYKRATEVVSDSYYSSIPWTLSLIVSSFASAIALIVYIVSIDPRILIVFAALIPVLFVEAKKNKLNYRKDKEMTPFKREKSYVQRVVFLRDYAKDMRTSGIYGVMRRRYDAAVARNMDILKRYGYKTAALEFLADLFGQIIPVGAAYGYSAYRFIVTKDLPIADFTVLVTAINSLRGSIDNIVEQLSDLQSESLYFGNLRDFMNYENRIVSGNRGIDKIESIEFRDVSFTYPGAKKPSLEHVSLRIDGSQTVAVVGKNGAGKSTFVKLLLRFYDPTEGKILINGVDLREYDLGSYRERIGTVFQDYKVFALSVNENVLCRECETPEDAALARSAMEASGAWDKIRTLPDGADTVLTREFDDKGVGLSGGERQKVATARMFAHAFDAAVLDEPSSALDPIAEYKMYESLIDRTRDRMVIYISHRLSSAVLSDNIFVFEDGRVVERGTHEALMASGGVYAEMFAMQASAYREGGDGDEA